MLLKFLQEVERKAKVWLLLPTMQRNTGKLFVSNIFLTRLIRPFKLKKQKIIYFSQPQKIY